MTTFLLIASWILGANVVVASYRLVKGPTSFDRVLALDAIALNLAGTLLLLAVALGAKEYLDAAIVTALLGFIGTMALATYLESAPHD